MAQTYGFFNSVSSDRVYNADQMSEYFDGLVSNGVYQNVGGGLQVIADSEMNVNVKTGRAIINCKWFKNDAVASLTIAQSHPTLNRYTAVVLRLDYENRLIELDTKNGTPASAAAKPTMQRDTSMFEICLAYVYVKAGATSITQSNITDMRASSLCGWITGLIKQVDTSELFLQWQNAYEDFYYRFEEWFAHLTKTLQVNTYIKQFRIFDFVQSDMDGIECNSSTIQGYEPEESDIINVYVDGKLADEWSTETQTQPDDYEISWAEGGGSFVVHLVRSQSKRVKLEVVIFKSIIGDPPTGGGSSIGVLNIPNTIVSNSTINVTEGN